VAQAVPVRVRPSVPFYFYAITFIARLDLTYSLVSNRISLKYTILTNREWVVDFEALFYQYNPWWEDIYLPHSHN
jgi:hypothetical protein